MATSLIRRRASTIMAYDFNTFVGGHLTSIGNKQDVQETKEFTMDVYQTVKRIHNSMDQQAVVAEAAKTIGYDNKFLLFKVILDKVTEQAVAELRPRGSIDWPAWMFGWKPRFAVPWSTFVGTTKCRDSIFRDA